MSYSLHCSFPTVYQIVVACHDYDFTFIWVELMYLIVGTILHFMIFILIKDVLFIIYII